MPSHWAGLLDFAANPPGSPALVILSNIVSPAAHQPTAEQMRYLSFLFSMALIFPDAVSSLYCFAYTLLNSDVMAGLINVNVPVLQNLLAPQARLLPLLLASLSRTAAAAAVAARAGTCPATPVKFLEQLSLMLWMAHQQML